MQRPIITEDEAKLTAFNPSETIQKFAREQPFLLSALIAEYCRLPKMAIITYKLLTDFMIPKGAEIVTVSRETVESLNSIVTTDKAKLAANFEKEQPHLTKFIMAAYEYVPKPVLLVYFGYLQQIEAMELEASYK
jgi:hypothetical protein